MDSITLELAGIYDVPDRAGQLRRFRLTRFNFDALTYDPESGIPVTQGTLEFAYEPDARRARDTFAPMIKERMSLRLLLWHRPQELLDFLVRWTSLEDHNRYGQQTFEARFTLALLAEAEERAEEKTEELG